MSDFEPVRKAIAQGDLDYALDVLEAIAGPERDRERQDLVLMRMRLSDIGKREMFGLDTQANIQASRAQLAQGLLAYCKRLETTLSRDELPAAAPAPASRQFRLPEENSLEKILSARSTLKRLAWLSRGLEVGRGVCRICTPAGRGTGFLIAPGLLVTNHHVIPDKETLSADETQIQFNFEETIKGDMLPVQSYRLDPAVFVTSSFDKLDCTIAGIAPNGGAPLSTWGFLELETRRKAELGEHVTIIQHPEGGVKQIALTANQVVNIFDQRIQYTTDTMPGSSGSPVFDDNWKVIALHHAGGNLLRNQRGDRIFANEGIAISEIAAVPEFRQYMK
jgi:V8-like Glu-specific endopeptidase